LAAATGAGLVVALGLAAALAAVVFLPAAEAVVRRELVVVVRRADPEAVPAD
jgi:hypothetical protein